MWNFRTKAEFVIAELKPDCHRAYLPPSIGDLKACSKYNCTRAWKGNPLQARKYETTMRGSCLKSFICRSLEDGKVFWGSRRLFHSHILSQVSTFTAARDKILGLRGLWSNMKWTPLWSDSFLILMHMITPLSWSCGVLTGGHELRTEIHHTFPNEFGLGQSFSLLPVSQLLTETVISLQLNKKATFWLHKIRVDNELQAWYSLQLPTGAHFSG